MLSPAARSGRSAGRSRCLLSRNRWAGSCRRAAATGPPAARAGAAGSDRRAVQIMAAAAAAHWRRTSPSPQVYKGRRRCTGQITAMKFIVKQGKSEKDIRNLRQEIEILRHLRHENIIQMLDAFETKDHFVVVMGALRRQPPPSLACLHVL